MRGVVAQVPAATPFVVDVGETVDGHGNCPGLPLVAIKASLVNV